MRVTRMSDANRFAAQTMSTLLVNEAENCLIVGIIEQIQRNPEAFKKAYFWVAEEAGNTVGAAWMTPPYPLGLTQMPNEAIAQLIDDVQLLAEKPSGIVGPKTPGEEFTQQWLTKSTGTLSLAEQQRIYQLDKVQAPSLSKGTMRLATEKDLDLLVKWDQGFITDCKLDGDPQKTASKALANKNRYIWEVDGQPKSMAGAAGPTPSGIRVNMVYTPPALRGCGYASALVASLSQKLLDDGKKFCFLYTDLSNPTSNSIYQKIGYRPVSDSIHYHFAYADSTSSRS
ncbi:MAG: GNAT family N-acetyltransferase [Oligoflexales bacterium]